MVRGVFLSASLLACTSVSVDLERRPCGTAGVCLDGFECHPETGMCAPAIERGCDASGGTCAWFVSDGDSCATPGSFLPCADGTTDCTPGCRTCLDDGTWSACSAPTCVVGEVWSCADCNDDCRQTVIGAEPICMLLALPRCNYDGSCWGDWVDADGQPQNGCECLPAGNELCDGVDNDCNGETDEGFGLGETCGTGDCLGGVWECEPSGGPRCSTMPGGSADASSVESCDGADDDCDGEPDDDLPCVLGATDACDVGVGAGSGFVTCVAPACTWGECVSVWWNDEWSRRLRVDIDTTLLAASVADLPVPVFLSPAVVDYDDFLSGGADIQFVDMDGVTLLAHDVETWNPGGESVLWVTLDSVDPAPAQRFFIMYYGRASPASPSGDPVWAGDFAAVWHLAEHAPGRGTAGLYRDATGAGHDGDDYTASDDRAGVFGPGQGFAAAEDWITVAEPDFAADATSTVEAWVRADAGASWVVPLSLSAPTALDGQQLVVRPDAAFDYALSRSDGRDLWFFDDSLRPLPHWLVVWNNASGDSSVWVRVPYAGTSALLVVCGQSDATSASDPHLVFDFYEPFAGTGLDATRWDVRSGDYTIAGGVLALRAGAIGLQQALPFDLTDNYMIEVRARFDGLGTAFYSGTAPEISSSKFTQGGNGGGDATGFMMRRVNGRELEMWTADGLSVGYNLGTAYLHDTTDGEWGTYTIVARPSSIAYYFGGASGYVITSVSWQKEIRYLSLGAFNGDAAADIMDTSYDWVRVRRPGPMPTAVLGNATAGALRVLGHVGLGLTPDLVSAGAGGVSLSAAASAGWHHVALVRDGVDAALYLDGSVVDTQPLGDPVVTRPGDLFIGGLGTLIGSVDEVRVSSEPRTAAWLAAQHAAGRGTLVRLGTAELGP